MLREQAARILEQQDQWLLARRRHFETEPQVEARCGFENRPLKLLVVATCCELRALAERSVKLSVQ